ncbi:MAG: BLUF domain-containing protein [Phycisphaerae bacterium]|nr:BLUF domain-containing protein [Phycisphaerae bacterium]
MNAGDLESIRTKSDQFNSQHGLTGALFYLGGNFMQILEGGATAVTSLYARIQTDPRHCECKVVCLGPLDRRMFPEWSMKVVDVDAWSRELRKEFVSIIMDAEQPSGLQIDRLHAFLTSVTLQPATFGA